LHQFCVDDDANRARLCGTAAGRLLKDRPSCVCGVCVSYHAASSTWRRACEEDLVCSGGVDARVTSDNRGSCYTIRHRQLSVSHF